MIKTYNKETCMKRKYGLLLFITLAIFLAGCGKKQDDLDIQVQNEEEAITNEKEELLEPAKEKSVSEEETASKLFSGETIIESETLSDNGFYLTWYDGDRLIVGLLPDKLVTEYNYPMGTKVYLEAINDGASKTESGKEAFTITDINYLEEIDYTTDEFYEEDYEYAYDEWDEWFEQEYGDNWEYSEDIWSEDYIEEYTYIPFLNTTLDYDASFYDEETGIWLAGHTTSNGKPFILDGFEYITIEDGYLYFGGRMKNTSDKAYGISLNVSIRDFDGYVLYRNQIESNVFVFESSTELTRNDAASSLTSKDLKLNHAIEGGGVGYFTAYGGFSYDTKINDVINIRSWNSEPYLIYVTVDKYFNR